MMIDLPTTLIAAFFIFTMKEVCWDGPFYALAGALKIRAPPPPLDSQRSRFSLFRPGRRRLWYPLGFMPWWVCDVFSWPGFLGDQQRLFCSGGGGLVIGPFTFVCGFGSWLFYFFFLLPLLRLYQPTEHPATDCLLFRFATAAKLLMQPCCLFPLPPSSTTTAY